MEALACYQTVRFRHLRLEEPIMPTGRSARDRRVRFRRAITVKYRYEASPELRWDNTERKAAFRWFIVLGRILRIDPARRSNRTAERQGMFPTYL